MQLIQPAGSSGTIISAFTQPNSGMPVTLTYAGPPPAIGPMIMLYDPSDSSLVGYYVVTAVTPTSSTSGTFDCTRQTSQGKSGSVSNTSLLSFEGFQKLVGMETSDNNSDSGTINPGAGWVDANNEEFTLGSQYLKIGVHFYLKTTVTVDGAWRLIADGGGYSSTVLQSGNLSVGTSLVTQGLSTMYLNTGSGTASVKLQVSTAAGTVVVKAGSSMISTVYYDL